MTKVALIDRVKKVNADAKSAGKRYVLLWAECVQHMFGDSHDWTVLATLIGGAAPKDAAILRALTGKAIKGYSLVKDEKQGSGLRFKKKEGEDQSCNMEFVATVLAKGQEGNVLQGKAIGELLAKPKDKVVTELSPADRAKKVKAHKAALDKWAEELGVTVSVLLHMLTAKDEVAH